VTDAQEPIIVGQKPRPRVLFVDCVRGKELDRVTALVPTSRAVTALVLPSVRQKEWDVAVVNGGSEVPLAPHLFVLNVGGGDLGELHATGTITVWHRRNSLSTEFTVPSSLSPNIRALVENDLLPIVSGRSTNPVARQRPSSSGSKPATSISPFLGDPDGEVLAGRFKRPGRSSETWFLPEGVDIAAWLTAALGEWSASRPDLTLEPQGWAEDPRWMTPDELAATAQVQERENELREATERLTALVAAAQQAHDQQRETAASGMKRLLTAQGEELVAAVVEALTAIGFSCQDMDAVHEKGAKLEDLRVTDADDPSWVALTEVRGYTRGAKVNDLMRLGRFITHYVLEQREQPAAVWYVVNSLLERPPTGRDQPLASHPLEVDEFATGGGLVIDTRELFLLWRDVASGALPAAAARARLRASTGRFSHPTVEEGPAPATEAADSAP